MFGIQSLHCVNSRFGGTVHIPLNYRTRIYELFSSIIEKTPYNYSNIGEIEEQAGNILRTHLPNTVLSAIAQVRDSDRGYVEITGTPEDTYLPPTPTTQGVFEKEKTTFMPELTSLGISHLFRTKVYNFRQEGWGTGALIFNIFPRPEYAKLKGAGGNENDFRLHMENAWHPQTPDGLILKGLRPDHDRKAITYAVANAEILAALSDTDICELQKPQFRISPPEIHRKMEKEKGIPFAASEDYYGPVLIEEEGGFCLRINFNGMKADPETPAAVKALKRLEEIAQSLCGEIRLDSENLILINNRRSIHTRNGYTPRYDGKDRLFQRYFLLSSEKLWRNLSITPQDFSFLSPPEAHRLLEYLQEKGIVKNGALTNSFNPYDEQISIPAEWAEHTNEILKTLIRKGPSFPNRVV